MTDTISIEEAMAKSGLSLENFERQLTALAEANSFGPETDVVKTRDYLRSKLVSRVSSEDLTRAQDQSS
jgi:hypothetical protein